MQHPPLLKPGDTICVVAPAYLPEANSLKQGMEVLTEAGFEVELCMQPQEAYHRFSATDVQRLQYLQYAFDHPQCKAIIAARGGYGSTRIIDKLNLDAFLKNPKWVIGYSDITALLLHISNYGITAMHGPMVCDLQCKEEAAALLHTLTSGYVNIPFEGTCRQQAVFPIHGMLVGGNLTVMAHCMGHDASPPNQPLILMLEDTGEYLYNVDRMWVQLGRAGWLSNVKVVVLGHFTELKDTDPTFGVELYEIFQSLGVPVVSGFPSGHTHPNVPWIFGAPSTIWIQEHQFMLSQQIV